MGRMAIKNSSMEDFSTENNYFLPKSKKSRWENFKEALTTTTLNSTILVESTANIQPLAIAPNSATLAVLPKNEAKAERQAKRLYLGNLPIGMSGLEIAKFLNEKCICKHSPK